MTGQHKSSHPLAGEEVYDILMILITAGADVYAVNNNGKTVSDIAFETGYEYFWKKILEECGYDAESVFASRKEPSGHPNAQHKETSPPQRCKLSFKEYYQRRIPLSRVEEVDSEGWEDVYEDHADGERENEVYFSGYEDSEFNHEVAGPMDSQNPTDADVQHERHGREEEDNQDFMDLFIVEDWTYVVDD
jgi:hypothetical protein